ncbi:MAG: hypothetical protein WCQ32_03860 [bacterium]
MPNVKNVVPVSSFEELQQREKELALIKSSMISKMKEVIVKKVKKAFSVTQCVLPAKMPSASNNPDFFAIKFQDIPFSILIASNTYQCIIELFDTDSPEKYFTKKGRWSAFDLRANRPHLFRVEYSASAETYIDTQNPLHHLERFSQNTIVIRKLEDIFFESYKEVHLKG